MSQIGIDMIDVGKGDAYLIDLYDLQGQRFSFAVDGGTTGKADLVSAYVDQYYGGKLNLVVSTHPDTDHIGGLVGLLESKKVNELVLNDPREIISEDELMRRARANLNPDDVETFKSAFTRMDELKAAATAQGTDLVQNLYGSNSPVLQWGGWSMYVLGPSQNLFRDLWLNEDMVRDWFHSDAVDAQVAMATSSSILDDPSIDTKPVNQSSIILLIAGHGRKYLFTGDAGKRALREAAQLVDISNLTWLDVPHHGSRRNMDTALINHLKPATSFISSDGSDKHPRKELIRALQRAGSRVYSTCRHSGLFLGDFNRPNWNAVVPWDFV